MGTVDMDLYRKISESLKKRALISSTRGAASDYIEAKANVIVDRILNERVDSDGQALQEIAEIKEEIRDTKRQVFYGPNDVVLPPREYNGLVHPELVPDESQFDAVNKMLKQQYACMIGAAGSGKTTTLRLFLDKLLYGDEESNVKPLRLRRLSGKQGLNIAMVAFTGIATQVIKLNMPEWLHPCIKTVHSLLEYSPVVTEVIKKNGELKETQIFMPMRHRGNKLEIDILLVDEASMLGVNLWHEVLDALFPHCKIFMIGDLNQLTPTASHSTLAYTLGSWPVMELTHIHRQKEPSANKIIDAAHAILNGNEIQFDNPKVNPDWRVIGYEIDGDPQKAGKQILAICNQLRNLRVHSSVDPTTPLIYDPYRDRIITAGNGYDENKTYSAVEQFPINEVLSRLIEPPSEDHPIYIIDAGITKKRFAVHYRVMATRNEPPDVEDRVTNGMVGVITNIAKNPNWVGNHALVGPEEKVKAAHKAQSEEFFRMSSDEEDQIKGELESMSASDLIAGRQKSNGAQEKSKREGGGPASHNITVQFVNGAERVFTSKTQVDSLMLAYATTCHKCQGSQMDTAIIIVHHACKRMLSREWLYTAVTRAVKRVIILYTPFGLRLAIKNQRIFGRNLQEKIARYQQLQVEGVGPLKIKVRLSIQDMQADPIKVEEKGEEY